MVDVTSPEDQETIREFLVESHENLSRLDQELVELEQHPQDARLLGSIFRTFHTIKGSCGFLAFSKLERLTHHAETLLSQLRDGGQELSPAFVSLILETVDATRQVLAAIEKDGVEGDTDFDYLTTRLGNMAKTVPVDAPGKSAGLEARELTPRKEPVEVRRSSPTEEEEATRTPVVTDTNIRVGVLLLDKLMDLVGELVLTRNQILQFNIEREDAALNATSQRLNLITSELQEGVMKTRMQPIGVVWNNLPRVVRDMAVALGKQIQLKLDGAETELDRTIIEAIKDPLIHLVRNSCDHGIESPEERVAAGKPAQGTMTLRAYHEGGQVNIEVGDDGAGIDIERVKQKAIQNGLIRPEQADNLSDREAIALVFQPGFSTAKTVSNLSGRGVGMDVVKSHIEKIGGVVDISSCPGEGTTVKMRIPLTLAIIPGLVVTSGGERFVIPQVSLLELIRLDEDASGRHIEHVHGTPVYRRRGSLLHITYLNQVLELNSAAGNEVASMVVLQAEDRQFGLVVDAINDTQEIVVKPLGKQLKGLTLYAGATIMGDGRVALILDVLGIGHRAGVLGEAREQTRVDEQCTAQTENERQRLLLFQAGSFKRLAVPLSLVARLEEFPLSAIEHAAGGRVVQYRNRLLPLVSAISVLEPGASAGNTLADPLQVVVFNDCDRSVGMVVDQILDVAEDAVVMRQRSNRKGLLGSAVVGGLVTDFLDFNELIAAARDWGQTANDSMASRKVLVADGSSLARGMIRSSLDLAGYGVLEAATLDEAIAKLERLPDIVVLAQDLPGKGYRGLLAAMRGRAAWESIPIVAVEETAEGLSALQSDADGFNVCLLKSDRTAILEAIPRLLSSAGITSRAVELAGEAR